MVRQNICILGATGSIGKSSLEVIALNQEQYAVHSLVAGRKYHLMYDLIKQYQPQYVALFDIDAARALREKLAAEPIYNAQGQKHQLEILEGLEGILELVAMDEIDTVISAIVGANGLMPTMEALKHHKKILLANKEALVMSGQIFFDTAKAYNATVLPIDSEHSAIYQCLSREQKLQLGFCDLKAARVDKILLTGSGGPFRDLPLADLAHVTAEQALKHPVWSMGPKISIDSSTMMNKGLEFIEARYLFNATDDDIEVLIHPQSIVHSMVSYQDGAVLAQMGKPSMNTPIAYALAFPGRIVSGVDRLDFKSMGQLSFYAPSYERYPCLKLAMTASRYGQAATTALNAANEICVDAFLQGRIKYQDIYKFCAQSVDKFIASSVYSIDEILELDTLCRSFTLDVIEHAI